MMSARWRCCCVILAAAALLPAKVKGAEPTEQNRYLLEQVKLAMRDDPAFRRSLERLVEPRLLAMIAAKQAAVDELTAARRMLEAKCVQCETQLGQVSPVAATLIVDNRCSYAVDLRINGKSRTLGPGRFELPLWTVKDGGWVSVELVGYELPKQWVIRPPDYQCTSSLPR